MVVLFFFSSRRRHTRFDCDWSSDVCSSDLAASARASSRLERPRHARHPRLRMSAVPRTAREMTRRQTAIATGCALRSEEHTSELQSQSNLVCRLLLEKKKNIGGLARRAGVG